MSDPTALPPPVLAQIVTPQAAGPAPQSNAQVVELPPELQAVKVYQTYVAEVVRQSSEGALTLRVDQGDIILQTSLTFQPQDAVTVRFNGAEAFVRLLSDAPEQLPASPVPQLNQAVPLSPAQIMQTPNLFVTPIARADAQNIVQPFVQTTETMLTAQTPIQSTAFTPSPPPSLLTVPQGDDVPDLRVSLTTLNTQVPLRTIAAQLPLTQPITADAPQDNDTAPLKISVTHFKNEVTVLRQTSEALLTSQRAGEVRAVFVGLTPEQHFPVFQTVAEDPQFFALRAPIEAIPIGTEITLNVSQTQNVLPLGVSLPVINDALWQSLNEVQETLMQQAQIQVTQAFQTSIPNISSPAQLTNSVLFFLVALRSGDVSGWLGEKAVETLKRVGKGDLVNRISNEFSALSRQENTAGDWRLLSLPMAYQGDIHKVSVSYRKDEEHGDDGAKTGMQTRFVMNLDLSAMGKVQLDALFSSSSKRLDLIARTENDFSTAAKQKMRGIYKSALDETQITGELSFSGTADGWVRIDEGTAPEFVEEI